MYRWPTGMGHQVSVPFPKNITLLEFFRVILVHNKSFLSTFYQLTDSTPKKNRPVRDAIYAELLVQSKKIPCKYQENIKITILNIKTKN